MTEQAGNKRQAVAPATRRLIWFSAMTACLFWTLLYRLGSATADIPDFVYANF